MPEMTSIDDHHADLWAFSLDRYARQGVSELCLTLQDDIGADVNVVLFCLWRGQNGAAVSAAAVAAGIHGEAGAWHRDVVLPLRAARRAMKGRSIAGDGDGIEACRDQLKALEIACERLEQRMLVTALSENGNEGKIESRREVASATQARSNLTNYLRLIAQSWSTDTEARIDKLVAACID